MCYADTCYLVALIKPDDVWKTNATRIEKQIREQQRKVWACETTFHELLMFATDQSQDPVRYIRDALSFVQPDRVEPTTILRAAMYMNKYKLDPADSLIVAHSVDAGARLITTDMPVKDTISKIPNAQFINLRSPTVKI
jgi:predicted nucleic acid-binding protein